jgi:hypothetical protein
MGLKAEVQLTPCYVCVTNDHRNVSFLVKGNPVLSSFMTYHQVYSKSNMADATSGAGLEGVRFVQSSFFSV